MPVPIRNAWRGTFASPTLRQKVMRAYVARFTVLLGACVRKTITAPNNPSPSGNVVIIISHTQTDRQRKERREIPTDQLIRLPDRPEEFKESFHIILDSTVGTNTAERLPFYFK